MTYSLISAATLGFDLVRLPAGRTVADVLLTGLVATPEVLEQLAAQHPLRRVGAAERPAMAVRSRRAREMAAAGTPQLQGITARSLAPDRAGAADGSTAALLEQLRHSTVGSAPALERLVRDDLLDPDAVAASARAERDAAAPADPRGDRPVAELAADVLADAAVAAYAAGVLPRELRRELSGPLAAAGLDPASRFLATDLGPQDAALRQLLADLAACDGDGRARWREATDALRDHRRGWATAMHEASWAAHVTGRTRATAAAQLLAVQAFDEAGFDAADGAQGLWNAVSGCVQGLALADALGEPVLDLLLEPWHAATGQRLPVPSS